jgi:dTDP-glucose 4,6-dehydratase
MPDLKNVLVTGGAGFIGANFVRALLSRRPGAKIIVLDLFTYAGHRESLEELERAIGDGTVTIVQGDICDKDAALKIMIERAIDTVVHFAAESHVDRSIHGPEAFIRTNVLGTFELLEAARTAWTGVDPARIRFHHVSTDEVYGSLGPGDPPFSETTPYDPSSPYSASKASSDHLVRAYQRTYRLPATISNCSNNYGPFQHPEKLIPLMILNAVRGRDLPVYGDGKQRRDWLYVEDHCRAILDILERGGAGETYNIGGASEQENIEIVGAVVREIDRRLPPLPGRISRAELVKHVADRPGHDRRYAMDFSKISRTLGWKPQHTFEEGLAKTIDWYLTCPRWLSAVMNKGRDFEEWQKKNYESREAKA